MGRLRSEHMCMIFVMYVQPLVSYIAMYVGLWLVVLKCCNCVFR
jgi:hypothetical protein